MHKMNSNLVNKKIPSFKNTLAITYYPDNKNLNFLKAE
jgi:hypothetical protein